MKKKRIGLVGARGYVGRELLKLLGEDETTELAFVTSKGAHGRSARDAIGADGAYGDLVLEDLSPADVAERGIDAVVLGLSNGQAAPWVQAMPSSTHIVDLSADFRFDDEQGFIYGLTERDRGRLRGARRIANPGCYATAAQLALWPFDDVIVRAQVFGVSGYSGAGNTPSMKNDLAVLEDNLLPYDLIGHTQERELRRHTGHDVAFMPHVAPFFRGISVTVSIELREPLTREQALARLHARLDDEPLIHVDDGDVPPLVTQVRERNTARIGGVHVDVAGKRLVLVAVIDNLRKGAATQALQNVHLALGVDELAGIAS
jgi:N-acetyl-gamma-glutamyl-phosphate reductase